MSSWYQGKLFVEHAVAMSHDSLHVIAGVLVFLVAGLVFRRPLSSWIPWLWLFAVILWSETVDLWTEQWPDAGMQYGEAAKDLLLTMFLPTMLLIAVRLRPDLFRSTRRAKRRR
jgi:hypothetical protein